MVGGGHYSTTLYIYRIHKDGAPTLKGRIPVEGDVFDIGLDDNSNVAVAVDGAGKHAQVKGKCL